MLRNCKCEFKPAIATYANYLIDNFGFSEVKQSFERFGNNRKTELTHGSMRMRFGIANSFAPEHYALGTFNWHSLQCQYRDVEFGTISASYGSFLSSTLSVLAMIPHRNESQIAHRAIWQFVRNRIPVLLVDDGSEEEHRLELINRWGDESLVSFEWLTPSDSYDWQRILGFMDDFAYKSKFDWIIKCDSDEELRDPSGSSNILGFIEFMDSHRFSIIDATVVELVSLYGDLANSSDATHYKYGDNPAHFQCHRAWRNQGISNNMARTGGHKLSFDAEGLETKVSPFNLTMLHMPYRNYDQTQQKIQDRLTRGAAEREAFGWHTHISKANEFGFGPTDKHVNIGAYVWEDTLFQRLFRFELKQENSH
jgi:hypothetical protein